MQLIIIIALKFGWWMSKEVVQSSKSCAFHSSCISSLDSRRETIDTEPSESPTVMDVAEGFQSRYRHIELLIFPFVISFRLAPEIETIKNINTSKQMR